VLLPRPQKSSRFRRALAPLATSVLWLAATAHAAGGEVGISVVRGTGSERVPQSLQVAVNERLVGLLTTSPGDAAAFLLRLASRDDPHEVKLTSADSAYAFRFRLSVSKEAVSLVEPPSTDSCAQLALRVTLLPTQRALHTLQLHFDQRDPRPEGAPACKGSARALGPQAMWKVKFTSQPIGASLFLPERGLGSIEYRRVGALTPLLYVSDLGATGTMRIFFKKPGYEECIRVLAVKRQGNVPMLRITESDGPSEGAMQPLLEEPTEAQIPQVHCELRAMPTTP